MVSFFFFLSIFLLALLIMWFKLYANVKELSISEAEPIDLSAISECHSFSFPLRYYIKPVILIN